MSTPCVENAEYNIIEKYGCFVSILFYYEMMTIANYSLESRQQKLVTGLVDKLSRCSVYFFIPRLYTALPTDHTPRCNKHNGGGLEYKHSKSREYKYPVYVNTFF